MTVLAEPLPDDPDALKALLLAERAAHAAETERLQQIIKELQRHRFGRRAETLPIDQLELPGPRHWRDKLLLRGGWRRPARINAEAAARRTPRRRTSPPRRRPASRAQFIRPVKDILDARAA